MDEKTESLNQSGAFLQIFTLNQLKKKNWGYEVETPRTVAPFVSHPNDERDILYHNANILESSKFPEAVAKTQQGLFAVISWVHSRTASVVVSRGRA